MLSYVCNSVVAQDSSALMSQILDPLPPESSDRILCCYVNATSKVQVARITNIANWYFERVVFPGQRLMFETTPEALLEIHTGMMASAILSDKIPCDRLQIEEEPESQPIQFTPEPTQKHNNHQKQEPTPKIKQIVQPFKMPALAIVD